MENSEQIVIGTPERYGRPAIAFGGRLNRRAVFIALAAGVVAGLFFGWDWLAAAGLTPFVVGLLPCAAMCAAGLCASRLAGKGGCHGGTGAAAPQGATQPEDLRMDTPYIERSP